MLTLRNILDHNESIDSGEKTGHYIPTEFTDGIDPTDEMIEWQIINPSNDQRTIFTYIPVDMRADCELELLYASGSQYTDYSTGAIRALLNEIETLDCSVDEENARLEEIKLEINALYDAVVAEYGKPYGQYETFHDCIAE